MQNWEGGIKNCGLNIKKYVNILPEEKAKL